MNKIQAYSDSAVPRNRARRRLALIYSQWSRTVMKPSRSPPAWLVASVKACYSCHFAKRSLFSQRLLQHYHRCVDLFHLMSSWTSRAFDVSLSSLFWILWWSRLKLCFGQRSLTTTSPALLKTFPRSRADLICNHSWLMNGIRLGLRFQGKVQRGEGDVRNEERASLPVLFFFYFFGAFA